MSRALKKRTMGAAIAGLALAFVGFAGAPAFAATGLSPAPSIDASGNRYFANNQTTATTVTGLSAHTDYYVGLCSNTGYLLGIPACMGFQSVTTDASGSFTASVTVKNSGANVHSSAPGQPGTVSCGAVDSCAIKVATHGTLKQVVDQSASFRVTP